MNVPLSPAYGAWRAAESGAWRAAESGLDLSASTTSNLSYDSLMSDGSSVVSSALSTSLNGFDIASLIASQGLSSLAQYRSLSAPAAYRTLSRSSLSQNAPPLPQNTPPLLHTLGQQRVPAEYRVTCGLTPPPSPGSSPYHSIKHEQLLPSPKRLNSQPTPHSGVYDPSNPAARSGAGVYDPSLPAISLPLTRAHSSTLAAFPTVYPGLHAPNPRGLQLANSSASSTLTNHSCEVPTPIRCSSEISSVTKDPGVERTTSGKRKRLLEEDYVMIEPVTVGCPGYQKEHVMVEPVKKEHSAQQDMRDLFEDIVQTRALLNQLKTTPSLSKRREKSRLNSLLDRKIKRFKEMRLAFLESCLTLENAALRNIIDKVKSELEFCTNRGIDQVVSETLGSQIDDLLRKCVSGDVKSFFASAIGISENLVEEDE